MNAGLFGITLVIAIITCWATNAYKFTQCDFESPYKCEVVHGVGLIPVVSLATVWVDTDEVD